MDRAYSNSWRGSRKSQAARTKGPVRVGIPKGVTSTFMAPCTTTVKIVPNTPPLFLVHATDDPISDAEHSITMFTAMKRNGVRAEIGATARLRRDSDKSAAEMQAKSCRIPHRNFAHSSFTGYCPDGSSPGPTSRIAGQDKATAARVYQAILQSIQRGGTFSEGFQDPFFPPMAAGAARIKGGPRSGVSLIIASLQQPSYTPQIR